MVKTRPMLFALGFFYNKIKCALTSEKKQLVGWEEIVSPAVSA